MTTTTEASTEVRTSVRVTLVMGDDAVIRVRHFKDQPTIGCVQVHLDGTPLYLSETAARSLLSGLGRALAAARGDE